MYILYRKSKHLLMAKQNQGVKHQRNNFHERATANSAIAGGSTKDECSNKGKKCGKWSKKSGGTCSRLGALCVVTH
jgi:hypothetical protein